MLALCMHNSRERRLRAASEVRSASSESTSSISSEEDSSRKDTSSEQRAAPTNQIPSEGSAQEYVVKTYTCQPVNKMDVREALVGTNKKFECQVIGFPPPNIRWFKDNVEITHDPRYHFTHNHEDGVVSMHIEVIKLSDAGTYQCRAENCEGYAITAAHLQVKAHRASLNDANSHNESVKMTTVKEVGLQRADDTAVVSSRRRPLIMTPSMEEAEQAAERKESAPKFLERPETLVCREDETIKVSTKCQGVPKPIVTWFRDGKLIKEDSTSRMYNKNDEYFLEIPGCSIMDSGEYTCTATNSQGAVFCSFNVHVEGKRISAHDLSAVEEEHSTDVQSDKEAHFLSMMFIIHDYYDPGKKVSFKYGDQVEVLDTQKEGKWLVRKKDDSLQVAYIPRTYLAQSMPEGKSSVEEGSVMSSDSAKVSKQKRPGIRRSSSHKKGSGFEDSSSGEEADHDVSKEASSVVHVAVADYESPEIKVYEGQFLEVLDQSNPHMWLVKTKPTKVNPSRVGWMPASYLEEKDGGGLVDRRSTREVFRDDIIKITDKPAEAKVKRKYALGDLVEAEKDYINDLSELIDQLDEEDPKKFKNQASIASELRDLAEFHRGLFLPELVNCLPSPSDVAEAFMKWQQWFESYVDYCSHRIVTEVADSKYDGNREHKLKYFAKPISQLKRYESLLKDFVRYTSRAGEDCSSLEKTLNMLMSIIKAIEDQQILNNIFGSPEDLKALGHILRHDSVTSWDGAPEKGKEKVRHMFLFAEDIVMTKPSKVGVAEHYEYKDKLPLCNVKVYNCPSKSADGERRFEIFNVADGEIEQYVVQLKNEYSKDAWLRDLGEAMLAAEITDYELTESAYNDLTKKRKSKEGLSPKTKRKQQAPTQVEKLEEHTTSPVTETDMYVTAAETDGSTYFTAAESEADSSAPKDQPDKKPVKKQQQKPQFIKPLQEKLTALKGGSLNLSVIVDGEPEPSVKWLKDGREMKKLKVKFAQKGNEYSAVFENLSWDHGGKYKVVATNSQGQEESLCLVKVTSKASEVTTEQAKDAAKPAEVEKGKKPKFIKQLEHEVAADSSSVRFDCKISADPEADVQWLHNYRPLPTKGSKYSFLFIDDESYTLIVNDLTLLDAGEYAVIATNKHGEAESAVRLKTGDIRRPKPKEKPVVEEVKPKTEEQKPTADDSCKTEEVALSEASTIDDSSRRPSISVEPEQSKSAEIIEEQVSLNSSEERKDQRRSSISVEHEQTVSAEVVEERVPITETGEQVGMRHPSVSLEEPQSKQVETVEENVPVNEVGEQRRISQPSITVELPQEKSTELVEERVPMAETEEHSRRPSVSIEPPQSKSAETVEERVAMNEVGDEPNSRRASISVEPGEEKAVVDDGSQEKASEALKEAAQELVVVEEINAADESMKQPPSKRLVSINSVDIEDEIVSKVEDDENQISNKKSLSKPSLLEGGDVRSKYTEQVVDAMREVPIPTAPTSIVGKPTASRSLNPNHFTLSWELPDSHRHVDNLTCAVEMCETGSDWRRVKSGIKDAHVELPSLSQSVRYRVIVENEQGIESTPSVSVMVQPGKWKEESSSLFSKLERKYMPGSADMNSAMFAPTSARHTSLDRSHHGDSSRHSISSSREISPITGLPGSISAHRTRADGSSSGYSSYKDHPSYQRMGEYITDTIDKYGTTSQPGRRRSGTADRAGWEQRAAYANSRNGEIATVFTGYTSTESDNFYWDSLKKLDMPDNRSLSQLMKAYADGYPIEPRFDMKDSSDQFAVEGRHAKIMCHVYTHANSDIKWYFKDEKILMDERYSSNLYPSGLCILEFPNMSWADAGEYKIKVQNRWGTSFRTLNLRVSDPPTFLEVPMKSYQLNRLDSLRVSCAVDGIPFPKVMFYRDWQLIPSASRCVVRQEGPDTHSLTINGVLVKDSGNYQIVAENEAGRIHSTFNILVEEGTKADGIVSVKKYLLEDHYYVLEEVLREETNSVHRVIEKSTGIPMYARIFTNPTPAVRDYAHQQMLAMQSASHANVVKLVNVIENSLQVVIMYEILTTEWLEVLFSYVSWTESFVAHCIKELLQIARYLHNARVSLANLQLENILYDKQTSQLKIDVWNAGRLLNSASLRAKYAGPQSIYCAPEVVTGEITPNSDSWNIGIIAYILLGGVPTNNSNGGISVDMMTLSTASGAAKDLISKLLQRESSERWSVEEALRHRWIKSASELNRGTPLDIGSIKAFIKKEKNVPVAKTPKSDEGYKQEVDVIKQTSKSGEEEAWLVDWFAKYKHDHDTYLVPIRELDMPVRLREYRKHFHQSSLPTSEEEVVEGYENSWLARTLRTRELPGVSHEEVLHVQLTREDLINLANQGLAFIEQQASEASGVVPTLKSEKIFRKKLDTSSFKVGEVISLECEIEGDGDSCNGFWYRNDELLMGDIEKNTVLISDRFTFSYAKDGKLNLVIKNAVPTDEGVYKCAVRGKDMKPVSTKARLLVGDVPGAPGRPIAAKVWDTQAYIVWSEPLHDGNSPVKKFKVDCKPQGSDRWIACHFTRCCSAIIEGLCPSTLYRFRVSAINNFGYSPYSWASPDTRTLREGVEEIVYTSDMKQAMDLSLTPHLEQSGAAVSSLSTEVEMLSALDSRRNSICDNVEEVVAKTSRAEDLYRFTQEVVHSFSNGALFKCKRKDTKQCYLAGVRGHTEATTKELEILKSLHHDHLQRLYDLYEQPSQFVLIFQDLSSENILHRLARKATYTERYVADALIQLVNGVEYLHYRDIIHGVVHPCNMTMSSLHGTRVVLTDFSQARKKSSVGEASSIYTEFLAPEVVMNEGVSEKADIWGIGLCALVLLSGKSPFHGETDEDTICNIQYLRFRISSVHPNSSQAAHKFIYNCLKRVPGNRPEACEVVNHPWLDVGHNIHQNTDKIIFPTVEFSDLSNRLQNMQDSKLKVKLVSW